MSLILGSKRIEKKKDLFKEIISNNDFLYQNIINKILLLVIDEYSNIKNYLNSQVIDYYKNINGYDYNDKEYHAANNHVIDKVYMWLLEHSFEYYNKVMKYEPINTVWDLIGLFVECCFLFTNMPVEDVGALYCDYSCYDSGTKVELIKPIPTFIKFNDDRYQDVVISFENDIDYNVKSENPDIKIEFAIWPVGEQDSVFCEIIQNIMNDLFSRINKKFCNKPMLFNNNYYAIKKHNPNFEVNDGQLYLAIYFVHVKCYPLNYCCQK